MLKGIGVSKGYGIGRVVIATESDISYVSAENCDPAVERERFNKALEIFFDKNTKLAQKVTETVGEKEGEIITGHIVMMQDPYMRSEIEKSIDEGHCAEAAFEGVCNTFIDMFSSVDDEFTKQRAADVKDIKTEILGILTGTETVDLSKLKKGTVVVAKELTPSMTACIDKDNVVGIITEIGSKTSHAAILARAMEIPAVLSVANATEELKSDEVVIVNGMTGEIIPNPTNEESALYLQKRLEYISEREALSRFVGLPTCTEDGIKVDLFGNIGTPEDAEKICEYDGEGIGLFRTEFLFMDRDSAPNENEQFEAYKKALLVMKGKQVIIRTLDIGGDKDIPYMGLKKEENPFLGFRAVRYCLKNTDLFCTQLRALIRASHYGNLSVMIPLVTGIEELREVKKLMKKIMQELDEEDRHYDKNIKVGVMIETPAAAIIADILAKEADFFSIGTNDLTGYTLAVDRGNANVAYLYSTFAPSVLRSIKNIIAEAKKAHIPVGMCGEAAADPMMIPLLISFGLDEFSVSATSILATRREISRWTKNKADEIAERIMSLDTEHHIVAELEKLTAN